MGKEIVIINGRPCAGKDTFVEAVKTVTCDDVINYSSIDKVKSIAKMCGWNGTKDDKSRKFLSDLKVLCDEFNDMTFNDMSEAVSRFKNDTTNLNAIMFIHIREPYNIKRAVEAFNAKTLLIRRPENDDSLCSNKSDADVFNYNYDCTVYNDGRIENLCNAANKFLIWLNLNR